MSKPSRVPAPEASDQLRPEYRFDYSKARPNPYGAQPRGESVAVVLDAEVAAAFPTSASVNTALRAVIVERPSNRKGRIASRQSSKKLRRANPAQGKRPRR
jgi:hypothetical protein